MKLKLVAQPSLCHLTLEQLQEVAANLIVVFDCNVRPTSFSPTPPADTSIPWVQTETCGGGPLGQVRTFTNGEWR